MSSEQQKWILCYMREGVWESPTAIGKAYRRGYHSAWASPKLANMMRQSLVERNERGHWRLTDTGITKRRKILREATAQPPSA